MIPKAIFLSLSRRTVLISLTLLFLVFNFLLNYFLPAEYALDLKFAYTVEQAYIAIGNLSKPDRDLYRVGILALDFPYMFVYGMLASGLLFLVWKNPKVLLIPLGIVLFDLIENILIIQILDSYPVEKPIMVSWASIITTCKWLLVCLLALFLLVGTLRLYLTKNFSILHHQNSEVKEI